MYKITVNDEYHFETSSQNGELLVNGKTHQADIACINNSLYNVIKNNVSTQVEVISFDKATKVAEVRVNNSIYNLTVKDNYDLLLDKMGLSSANATVVSEIKAPMPGLVLKIFAKEQQDIKKGENLLILEAMKMENIIKAPADVKIKSVFIKEGGKVEKGQVMISF
ncbi:acetyl-CoA carboxylase biotin carboxyl carrier protein subunit [Mucilaginibacter terrenus]|uniref:Acetyl-CoA carboxylase biotin carboxyl carrier protein subunit n=1 Tax=Mucilaginibacter terrenus TaxID=2482727 RepID=A0A3E2NPQ9_9SPHI|nr:acetyl-CoA carboxylase biotin carboxyl carrier protein subunit [Mucilaginibacter terrenus]RFZ82978.1 acetyl-CoA carboxylase biotin carboxyl carrier protein subunit [Mucilaginibacter terrenus]